MADGANPLRGELEKVRDRARLLALSKGANPKDAEARAAAAVDAFCAKWGIRVDASGNPTRDPNAAPPPAAAGPGPAPGAAPAAPRVPMKTVDLGSSPLRHLGSSPEKTQPIRISELLRKVREGSGGEAAPVPAPGVERPTLGALLDRIRSRNLPAAPGSAPPSGTAAGAAPPRAASAAATAATPATGSPLTGGEAVVAAAASLADRRRQLLDEFDRTYEEVQTMIEARIAESQGEAEPGSGPGGGAHGEYTAQDIQFIARDLERLRGGLRSMLSLCEELMTQLRTLVPKDGDPPAGGAQP